MKSRHRRRGVEITPGGAEYMSSRNNVSPSDNHPPFITPTLVFPLFFLLSVLRFRSVASFSMATPPPSSSKIDGFQSFEFDPSTGICRSPSSFRCTERGGGRQTQHFVMRNTPGDGDCVFHAVLSSVFVSMGTLDPDSSFSAAVSSMALEMRGIVARLLSSPEGTLYVNDGPRKRIVRCRDLLRSAADDEGLLAEDYLAKLRRPGKRGGLYGGGPELVVLSNILRRPISIYHLKPTAEEQTAKATAKDYCEIERIGVFGAGLFEDPGKSVPDSVVSNAVFFTLDGRSMQQGGESSRDMGFSPLSAPLKCSWHLHILIVDACRNEKHATVLLPSVPILHNN